MRPGDSAPEIEDRRRDLRADCGNCFALCCVAQSLSISADFAIDKPAGTPCPNLRPDDLCGIHDRLRAGGFPGCAAYDCFGAGQRVSQRTFRGHSWRDDRDVAAPMFAAFAVVRQLHELLWYLTDAMSLAPAHHLHPDVAAQVERTERLAEGSPESLLVLDVAAHRADVNAVLLQVSDAARTTHGPAGRNYRGADLAGRDLRRAALRRATFRGAILLGADLRAADLQQVDFIGADLRGADLRGADLTGSFFLTQPQVNAARGDARTRLPASVTRPAHWPPPLP